MKTIDIHGKPYVMVKDRVIHFNKEYPNGCIQSKMIDRVDKVVIFEATAIPDIDKPERFFTGHAEEEIGSTQINRTSALENCETSAVGRALAMMGIGADESFASGDEVANAVYRQKGITKDHAEKVAPIQDTSKTTENVVICPKRSGGMADNKEVDGQPKKSHNYDKLVAEGKTRGLYQPLYKCLSDGCGESLWKEPLSDNGEDKLQQDKNSHEELPF